MNAERLTTALGGRWNGRNGLTSCPNLAHVDKHPSFDIADKGSRVVFICRAGCSQREVIDGLRARGLWGGTDGLEWSRNPPFRLEDHLSRERRAIPDCCLSSTVCGHWAAFDAEYLIVNLHKNLQDAAAELKAKLLRAEEPITERALREGLEFAIQFGAILPMGTAHAVVSRLIDVVLEGI